MMGEMGKNVWYLYQARRVNTQTNAGGGALTTRLSMATGQIGIVVSAEVVGTASAGSALTCYVQDEDGANVARLVGIAAAANLVGHIPNQGSVATATNNLTDSQGLRVGPGSFVTTTASAALQNETLTVGVVLLLSTDTVPTWDTTGSAGTPSLAASTISAANTMQAVLM